MQKAIIPTVYNSGNGHTKQLAALLTYQMRTPQTAVHPMDVSEAKKNSAVLHHSDAIVFHPGDHLTTELFARRIIETTLHFKYIKNTNHDTFTN